MMKKTIVLFILIFVFQYMNSQVIPIPITSGMTGLQLRNALNTNFDSLDTRWNTIWLINNLLVSDTSSMLIPYINHNDTVSMLTPYINHNDTVSMLTPYINHNDTVSMLMNYVKLINSVLSLNGRISLSTGTSGVGITVNSGRRNPSNLLLLKENNVTKVSIDSTGNATFAGEVKYEFPHAIGSADSVSFVTGTTKNKWYKINPTPFTWRESDDITTAGDSARIVTVGHYEIHVWVNVTTANANDQMKIKMFVNNAVLGTSLGMFKINSAGTGNGETHYFMWYRDCSINDWLSWRIQNLTAGRAMTVTDFKVYIKKLPED